MPASRRPRLPGPVQQMILAALIRLGPDIAATELRRHVIRESGHWLPPQQVHTALDRLVARGYVTSWSRRPASAYLARWLRPGPDFPQAARRFVSVTTLGRRSLRLAALPCDRLRHGLPGLGHEDRPYERFGSRIRPRPPAVFAADTGRSARAADLRTARSWCRRCLSSP